MPAVIGAARAFDSGGGIRLAAERWVPAGAMRAQVVFVHGLGEHRRARPYVPFYERLAAHGYAVFAFDLRGHGESEGPRLYARDFAILEQDVARAVEVAADDAEGRPVFVIGGSLGGLLAIASALAPHDVREIVRRQALPGYRLCIERGFRGVERLAFVAIPREPFVQDAHG